MPRGKQATASDVPDLTRYAEKDITDAMSQYADWLTEATGYKVDPRSVALAGTLRMQFQAYMREHGSDRAHVDGRKPPTKATPAKSKTESKPTPSKTTTTRKTTAKASTDGKPAKEPARRGAAAKFTEDKPATPRRGAPRSGRKPKPADEAVAPY